MALRANFEVVGPDGERSIEAEDFCTGLFTTDLNSDELLAAVVVRREEDNTGSAYAKMFNPASRYAMLGAAAVLSMNGDTCEEAHVAIGGLTPKATRARAVEAALEGQRLTSELLRDAAAEVHSDLGDDLIGDVHASAEYRRKVAPTYVQRALEKAWQRAT
jgi:carbon-monoxide dehydrogenase medium subunit